MAAVQGLAERVKGMDKCYIDAKNGKDDETSDGSSSKPFASLYYAYVRTIDNPSAHYLEHKAGEDSQAPTWEAPAKSAVKKAQTRLEAYKKKLAKEKDTSSLEDKQREQRLKNLEDAKRVVIQEDPALPKPVRVKLFDKSIELGDGEKKGTRVQVSGRIHRLRVQKHATFLTLKDGYGLLQCIIPAGDMTKTYDALTFAQETSLTLHGELRRVPAGQTAPDDRELHVDYYKVLGAAPGDEEALTNRVSSTQALYEAEMLDARHLVLRGELTSSIMKLREAVELAFIKSYEEMRFRKVHPPAIVQTQVEGGATLFTVPYYGEEAYLTQSSQLYLETCLPSLGNVYCIENSFRAEKSLTRRHLAEYTHIEGELDFIDFDDLLEHLEEIICRVISKVTENEESAKALKILNPGFQKPSRPFMRMKYADAIDWLNKQDPPIPNEDGKPHAFGDDIAEAAERRMTDIINRPIFLTHFPVEIKAFYMKKDPSDTRVTESVDVLMPGVGEIVGGSMRMEGYEELLEAYKKNGIGHEPYYWYTDQRKYGTSPHGGYGLGLERFLAWLGNQHTVRTCCLYPRFMGRARP